MVKRAPIHAWSLPERRGTIYPKPYNTSTEGRGKRALGVPFGLDQFGVNLTTLDAGAASALLHRHSAEDELVYVLEGTPTLVTEQDGARVETALGPGDCIGFKAGSPKTHAIVNRTDTRAVILEIGSRRMDDDHVHYADADMQVVPDGAGGRKFLRKDGTEF